VLVICSANACRSPMAQALLARRLAALGDAAVIRSGGTLGDGDPALPDAVSVMAGYGIDIGAHRSRRITTGDLDRADLTLAMARENLRCAVVIAPAAWPRTFTLGELVRRGQAIGPRGPGESLVGWLARAHAGRQRTALLGSSAEDDVADPAGGPRRGYEQAAAVLSQLIDRLVQLCWDPDRSEPAPELPDLTRLSHHVGGSAAVQGSGRWSRLS
jgi:protein-tyrosine phosphatase